MTFLAAITASIDHAVGQMVVKVDGPVTRPSDSQWVPATRPTLPSVAAKQQPSLPNPIPFLPQTRPASQAAPFPEMRRWFADLANPDPNVRQQSMVSLMGLHRSELPALQKLVEESRPLAPDQLMALRPIVIQVYLADDAYDVNPGPGFLGIHLPPITDPSLGGAVVVDRLAGFVASRMLRDGDVILEIQERPDRPIRSSEQLTEVLSDVPAGTSLRFVVLRQGQLMVIPITLDPRPADSITSRDAMELFNVHRLERADDYWTQQFASLLSSEVF